MSTLEVGKIVPATGTAITLGESGDTLTVPSGGNLTVASGATTVVLGVMIGNTTTSQVTATVSLASTTGSRAGANNENNQTVELVTNAPVPVGGTLELLSGNKVVMEAGDALSLTASGSSDIAVSIMEIT